MQQGNKVHLGYWGIRGLSERVRMLLEYVGIPYEETKYTGQTAQKWFSQVKPELHKKNPAITLPYLIDGDKVISQSDAVLVYIVHKSGKVELLGRNADEQVSLATAMGVVRDLHPKYITLVYGRYGQKSFEQAKAQHIEQFKPFLAKLNSLLEGREYYAGQITWIDFPIAQFMQCLWLLDNSLIESYPNVWNHQKRIWQLPAIKAYHQTDRWHERPINNPSVAKWY